MGSKKLTMTGCIEDTNPDFKFWFVVRKNQKVFLPKPVLTSSGFTPEQLGAEVEVEYSRNHKGLKATKVLTINGKTGKPRQRELSRVTVGETYLGEVQHRNEKGFGFIRVEGHQNVFFHAADSKVEFVDIQPGAKLRFAVTLGDRGLKAMVTELVFDEEEKKTQAA